MGSNWWIITPHTAVSLRVLQCSHCHLLSWIFQGHHATSIGRKYMCRSKYSPAQRPAKSHQISGESKSVAAFLAATKQLYEWFSPSVRPSVRLSVCLSECLSVCHTFFTMFLSSYHHEIVSSYYQWKKWCPCKNSRSEFKGQGHRGQNPT